MSKVQVHADGQVITPQTLVQARECGRAGGAWVSTSEYSTVPCCSAQRHGPPTPPPCSPRIIALRLQL